MIPKEAMLKLTALRGQADDARGAVGNAHRRISEIRRLLAVREQDDREALEAEMARLETVQQREDIKFKTLSNLVASLDDWLRRQRNAEFVMARSVTAKPHKGEKPEEALARVRGEIETAVAELAKVRNALPPKGDIKSSLAVKIRAMAANGAPTISIMPDGVRLTFAEKTRFSDFSSDMLGSLLAWLDAEKLIERLGAEIDKRPESALALNVNARAERIADLSTQIENLSRIEESLCEEYELLRRASAHPLAVLGLGPKDRKAAVAA